LKKLYDETGRRYDTQLLSCHSELRLLDTLLSDLTQSLQEIGDNTELWARIITVIESRRKVVETESKQQATHAEMISKHDVLVYSEELTRAMREAITRRVGGEAGQEILQEIAETFIRVQDLVLQHGL